MRAYFLELTCTTLLMMLLGGCVETAFVAGAATGGMVVYDQRDVPTIMRDRKITHQIAERLYRDPLIQKQSHVEVATFNGLVLLTGQIPQESFRERVLAHSENVPGVRRVYSDLKVSGTSSLLTRSSDSLVTAKVHAALLVAKGLRSSQLKVVTENGTVYLMGIVSKAQAEDASEITRHIHGVQRVVKVFEYRG